MIKSVHPTHWLTLPGLTISALIASLFLHEWARIGVIANPTVVGSYHFGSEAMVGYGGWHYTSAEVYSWTAFMQGAVASLLTIAFLLSAARRSRKLLLSSYVALVTGALANQAMFLQ